MSSSTPESPSLARRAKGVGAGIGLFVVGVILDVCGVVNVPGATTFSRANGGEVTIGSLGTVIVLLVLAAWATVFWRERYPLLPLIAGGVLAVIGVSYLLLLIGAVAFVRRRPDRLRLTAILVGVGVLFFAAREAFMSWGGALPWFLTSRVDAAAEPVWILVPFVFALLSLGIAAGVIAVSRSRERADRSDRRAAAEVQRADVLTEQAARQAERERIARDMHDALAHRLSVVSLHAGALEAVAGQGDTGEMARTVREQTHAALQDMRGLIGELRSPNDSATAPPATMRAIGSMLSATRATGQQITSLVIIESPERAGALCDSGVHRIVQESLTNAIKHASGSTIDVFVHVSPAEGARLRVVNPLVAVAASEVPGGGNGILGIRERVAALGGEAWIGGFEGSFIVDVTLPWQERG
ncbi:sensor histidine kinase [Microbacterium sp. NPDC090218]